ncbi:hypothetical protein FA048_10360 [Pedobacter polaris]|uniref:Uncharacterized protein n=1 Tax=Pedobacter polaris TaxID=2571273 RepID=A0A4U1CS53_9SPHI|nr:hypothetical protein [Pedobacter polaris]TKC10574.1 hypothetical protein FA048_10360 [Pedobacter polaris]
MKLINAIKFAFLGLVGIAFIASCTADEKSTVAAKVDAPAKSVNPFPFYKNIEIKPGLNFEVLSWGKGIDTLGGYLILMSDSVKNNYRSISVERKGIIAEAWNMDLDNDGNPELYIQYLVRKDENDLNVYEYANNSFDKISFPGLNSAIKKGYQGNDKFFVKNGDLFRSVPVVSIDSGKTTTLVKTLQYNLRGNSFSTSEVKPEE